MEEADTSLFSISDMINMNDTAIEDTIFIVHNHQPKSVGYQPKVHYVKIKRANYIKNS